MAEEQSRGLDPGRAAAGVAAAGIGMVADMIDGTLGAVGHLENIAVAVPNTVIQTGAQLGQTATGAADQGFDTVLANVRQLLEQAKNELQQGVRDFGTGLPNIGG